MRSIKVFILLILLLTIGCEKEAKVHPKQYPYAITKDPVVNEDGATFSADMVNPGDQQVLKYGFVWCEGDKPTLLNYSKLFENDVKTGLYSFSLNTGLTKGKAYSVRSYVKTAQNEIYGNIKSFVSLGSLSPEIYSFSPGRGHAGTKVEISGKNFSSYPELNIVKFDNKTAIIDSASENKLIVIAPAFTESKDIKISVNVADVEVIAADPFNFNFSWYKMNNFIGGKVHSSSSFTVNNKGYVYGGYLSSGFFQFTKKLWEYDILSNSWSEKKDNPFELYFGATSFTYENKGYIISSDDNKEMYEYDPDTDSWVVLTKYPGKSRDLVSFIIGDELFTGLGGDYNYYYNEFYKYSFKTNTWVRLTDFIGEHRYGAISFSINGKGYIGTGHDYNNDIYFNDFWEYDPSGDSWTRKPDFPGIGRFMAIAFTLHNKGYVGLGTKEENYQGYSDLWCFDPEKNSWEKRDDHIGLGKWENVIFSTGDRVFVGPGSKSSPYSSWSIWSGYDDLWEFKEN